MIAMTPEVKEQLLNLGRDAVDNSKTDIEILKKLIINSKEVVTNKIGKRELPGCDVYYTSTGNPELLLWATGLICMRWTLYLLKQKAIEGICHTHNEQTGLPCPESQKFHNKLFNEVKKNYKELIFEHDYENEVKNDILRK